MKKALLIVISAFIFYSCTEENTCCCPDAISDNEVDDKTVLLLHFNYDIFDFSPSRHTVSNIGGEFSASERVHGIGSMNFDGKSYIDIPDSEDWNFGTEDFTIDFWVRDFQPDKNYSTYISNRYFIDGFPYNWVLRQANGSIYFTACTEIFNDIGINLTTDDIDANDGKWRHIALVRNGNTFTFYVNGIHAIDETYDQPIGSNSGGIRIGESGNTEHQNFHIGNLDEFRISKGIARWTADFIPPNKEY